MSGETEDDVRKMSVKELKAMLVKLGSSGAGCIEKSELQERLIALLSKTATEMKPSQEPVSSTGASGSVVKGLYGLLDCVVIESGPSDCKGVMTVLLMHGYGANKEDLAPIGDQLMARCAAAAQAAQQRVRFLVADAPFALQGASRQWWPLDMMRLAMAAMSGQLDALFEENTDDLTNSFSTKRVVDFLEKEIEHVRSLSGDVEHRIVLAGFSQGAMLAANVALRNALRLKEIRALCLFSSAMISKSEWESLAKEVGQRQPPLRVLQSHGKGDPIVPYAVGVQLNQLLTAGGIPCQFVPFEGPHTIPMPVISSFLNILQATIRGE
mmetsp:Transcript_15992/g.62475  ORF Transcript_15992/g.62475 Transcript_15992/m.62475 type:complete len:325 (-) Transcript_15992:25-999(-)